MDKEAFQEKDLVSFVEDRSKAGSHEPLDMQNYINLAYYVGQQWIALDNVSKRLIVPPKDPNEVRYTANMIQPIVRTEQAKMTKNKPVPNVIPATGDDEDIQAAHTGEKVCEAMEFQLDLAQKDNELIMWGLTGGIGFIEPYWNDNLGVEVAHGVFEGDVDIDVLSAFEIKWDPSAKKWDDVHWFIKEKTRSVEYVKALYGKEVTPEKGISTSNLFDSKLANLNNLGSISYKNVENSVIVKEYWEKPSSKYPKGRRITVANNTLLFFSEDIGFGEEDRTQRELPIFPFVHIHVPGRVHGMSIIENLIPIQRERNKSRSQIIKNKNLVGSPPWVVEEGALIDDIEGGEGEIILYKRGFDKPQLEQPSSMGADVYRNIEQCDSELEFVSGQHETSHGQVPAGVKSGIAISFLQEQDDTKLAPSINSFERCKAKYMSYILKIIRYKYTIERTVRFVGKNNTLESVTFKGSDLSSTDVRVIPGSALPQSRVAKQDFVLNLVDRGVLNPERDKAMILRMLELGFTDNLYDDYSIDVNHALAEQEKWKKGDFSPPVRDFYNHQAHVNIHNKFRKSDEYEQLGPESMQLIDEHVMMHDNYMKQMIAEQINSMTPPPNQPVG